MENKKIVYLSDGEEAELLAQYKDGNKIEYVVKIVIGENVYEEGSELIYENRIVSNVYEKYEDVPMVIKKAKLREEVEELEKKIKELKEKEANFTKKLKSVYNPKFPIGTPIYFTDWGNEVEELKIVRIVFEEEENRSFYRYYLNKEYRDFEEIGDGYYLTKEEAEMARQEYLENKKIEEQKRIEENYKRAKEEYEKLIKSSKIK
jgi:polyhydroxyalkanoate synthesis regulator phasin